MRPFAVTRFLLAAALALLAATVAAALPPGITQGASVEGVTEYTLANGLKVLLFPDATKPTTTVNLTYLVGSRQENYGETGMAHLLEHMLFKGTPTIPSIFQELGKRGMHFNGSTFYDRTNYFETFAASGENLDWALRMEAERMTQSTFTKQELDTEMTVVRNEFENWENNPRLVLWGRMQAVAFDWHNYGNLTIGARSDIENVPFEKLRAYYRQYYQPDNAVLVVAGQFDPASTLDADREVFRPDRETRPRAADVLHHRAGAGRRADGHGAPGRAAHSSWGRCSTRLPGAHPDSTALEALGEIMTVKPAGRLYKALVETKKASGVENWQIALHDPGMIIFWAQVPTTDSVDTAREALLKTLYDVRAQPIADAELERVRAKALKAFDDTVNDPQQLGVALSEMLAEGDWRLLFLQRDRWRNLKAADVQRVAFEYIKAANLTLGQFVPDAKPDRAPVAPTVDLAAMVKDYKGDAAIGAGETFDPTPANLEARTQRFTLPNGMKVALLPKKTRGETVQFQLQLHYGDEKLLLGTAPAGGLAASMLTRGTVKRNRQEFEDLLDRLKARLFIWGEETETSAHGETVRANLAEFLRLAAEALRQPAFASVEFDTLKRERTTALEKGRTDPQAIVRRALARHDNPYPPADVRYTPTLDEELAKLNAATLEQARAFHARFVGGANAELAIIGDFDVDAVRALAGELFGAWASPSPYARVPEPYIPTTPWAMKIETPDKSNAVLLGKIALPMSDASADYPALVVADKVLGASPESRIPDRVREREGLSYSVGTILRTSSLDDNSRVVFYAIFAPENLERVRKGLREEIDRALKDGFTEAEIATAKKALLQERQIARAQDNELADALVAQAYVGRTWDYDAKVDSAIEAASPEAVLAVLRKYVKPDDIAYALGGDFAKGK